MAQNQVEHKDSNSVHASKIKGKSFDNHDHHVKFQLSQEELSSRHENIEISKKGTHQYGIHLGYLKVDHYYRVQFRLEHDFHKLIGVQKDRSSPNVSMENCVNLKSGEHEFVFVFYAYHEKVDIEQLCFAIHDEDNKEAVLMLNFEAKVLGAHQGTPVLRNGVTLMSQKHANMEKAHFS